MKNNLLLKTTLYSAVLAGIAAGFTMPANAQDAPGATVLTTDSARSRLEEVTVTARRRQESLQQVPVAVTAFTGQQLESAGIVNLEDLRFVAPALLVMPSDFGSSVPGYTIRGQRQAQLVTSQDTSVVVYFADFALAKPHGTNDLMYDLDSVQVLKGPQGTLFGRNTTGGAVLINPNKPDPEAGFSGSLTAEIGDYDYYGSTAVINGAITDTLAARVAGKIVRRDGYTESLYDGQEFDDNNSESWRAGLLWAPNDNVESYTVYQHYRQDNEEQGWKLTGVDAANANLARLGLTGRFQQQLQDIQQADFHTVIDGPFDSRDEVEAYNISNTTSWEVGEITLKNILGYRDFKTEVSSNYQGTDILITTLPLPSGAVVPTADAFGYYSVSDHTVDGNQWSDELQVLGTALDERMDWIGGLYYFSEQAHDYQLSDLVGRRTNDGDATNESYSAFAQINYDIPAVEGLSFTAGGRYTWDDRELEKKNQIQQLTDPALTCRMTEAGPDGVQVPLDPCVRTDHFSDSAPSWTLGLDYQFTDSVMGYLATRRGYRSGGLQLFTQRDDQPSTFDPEYVTDYEIGIKSTWDANGVGIRLNTAIYRQDYEDIQRIQAFSDPRIGGALTTQVLNAAEATIDGGELEMTIIPSDYFEVSGFVGYVDAEYDKFVNDVLDPPRDYSDNDFAFVPEMTAGVQLQARIPVQAEAGEIWLRGSWYTQDEMELSDQNDAPGTEFGIVPSYDLFDMSVSWTNIFGSSFDAQLMVKNVTDEEYYSHGFATYGVLGFTSRYLGAPRTIVGQVTYHFGE